MKRFLIILLCISTTMYCAENHEQNLKKFMQEATEYSNPPSAVPAFQGVSQQVPKRCMSACPQIVNRFVIYCGVCSLTRQKKNS